MKTKLSVTFASTDFRNKGGVASVLWRKATIADCYIEIPGGGEEEEVGNK